MMSQLTLEIRLKKLINVPQYILDIEKEKPFRVITIFPGDENVFSSVY